MTSAERETRDTRGRLIEAASRVVVRDGVSRLTLDAVSKEAEVSKGGLLYHFPNKEALVVGLIEEQVGEFDASVEREIVYQGRGPGRWLRAYATASFQDEVGDVDAASGLLAAVATNPELMVAVQARFRAWQEKAEADGLDPALATVIRLAADGLTFAELFGLAPPTGELRARVLAQLLALASPEEP